MPMGAVPRSSSGSKALGWVIGIVVGLFALIAIVGILAAIAIPNMLTAMQRSKQKRTMADIRSITTAAEAYKTDNKHYPAQLALLSPTYLKAVPSADGWAHPFEYVCWPEGECANYALLSGGSDQQFEHSEVDEYANGGATTNFDRDIVCIDGKFVQYPHGISVE
jgi:type II secretory pathway pseudopilin PulG